MGGHADDVPIRRICDVIFHEIRIIIGASLACNLQIHTARCMAHPDAGFYSKFMTRPLHQTQIHIVGYLALNQGPPNAPFIRSGIHEDRGVALSSLTKVHSGGSVAWAKEPTLHALRIQLDSRTIKVVDELSGSSSMKQQRRRQDQ